MPETITQDDVVSDRTAGRSAISARPHVDESFDPTTGTAKSDRSGIEEDKASEGNRKNRVFKESTEKLIEKFEAEAKLDPHEVGDADEDEPADDTPEGGDDAGADAADEGDGEASGDAGEGEEPAKVEAAPDPTAEWQTKYATLEERNRALMSELDTARETPKSDRTERETQLLVAEQSYVDEGTVPALRKFLGVVIGAAPDSKEVDAELAGLYTDLTARELGVALDQNQQTLRDNARTRLILARDKREKAEGAKKTEPGNGADEVVNYEAASNYVGNVLSTKGQSGASLADEFPMLMDLAEDFDGCKPAEVLARAIRQEIMVGTLSPETNDVEAIRTVASKIEKHYDGVAKRIEAARAKKTKPDTTTPSAKPKVAPEPSQEQRQSKGARTITNATASVAPAKPPKAPKQKASTTEKKRGEFKSDAAYREYLLDKHGIK